MRSRPAAIRAFERYRRLISLLRQTVREERPDVIHAHSPFYVGAAAQKVAREAGIPCVYEMRASWEDAAADRKTTSAKSATYNLMRRLESSLFQRVDAVVTICQGLKQEVLERGIPESKIDVVPNAVRPETIRTLPVDHELRASLGWSDGPAFGYIGSLFSYEGVERLLDAAPAVIRRVPNARFLVLGGGEREQQIREGASRFTRGEFVCLPRVPHGEIHRYYSVLNCMVYPRHSIRLTEMVTPLKPLEAMAMGRTVIASDIGGHRELIRQRDTGLLFDNSRPEDLAGTLLEVATNSPLAGRLAANGQSFVSNYRTWGEVSKTYLELYDRLTARRTR